jgi:RNA polymerase sigma-70 factor (sigma-E family)
MLSADDLLAAGVAECELQGIWPLRRVWGVEKDRREFEEFYAAARDHCLQVVLLSVGDRHLADDLVAEAFTRAWASWRKVRGHPAPRAWVVRTALNMHVSWWRRRRREVALGSQDDAVAASQHPGLDSSLITALRRLPARQREVIVLRLLLDLDTATTARTLDIPSGTVASHLHRGLAALRHEIPALDYQERIT